MGCTKATMMIDAHEIDLNLWQGSIPATDGRIQEAGFNVLVLCARELQFEDEPFDGLTVIRAPNDDDSELPLTRTKLRDAIKAADQVAQEVRLGHKVLVTCAAGLNRSGLVTALALHKLHGWGGKRCIQRVRDRRTSSKHHPNLFALCNPDFVAALQRLRDSTPPPRLEEGWALSEGGLLVRPATT